MASQTVEVPGISCGHCVRTIEKEVGAAAGVRSVSADQQSRKVTVDWDEGATSWDRIRELLTEIHYPPAG